MSTRLPHQHKPAPLVMTATITPPPGATHLSRRDPQQRLQDYAEALKFYLSLPTSLFDRIIFIDNSAADVSPLAEVARVHAGDKTVHVSSFVGNDQPPVYGKGYGEFRILDHAMKVGGLIGPDEVVWKVTGRLRCINLPDLVSTSPRTFDLYADFKRHRIKWVELRVFAMSRGGYAKLFENKYEMLREDVNGGASETFLFDHLMARVSEAHIVPRFKRQPRFEGFGGQFNNDLGSGREWRRTNLRAAARHLVPWIWF